MSSAKRPVPVMNLGSSTRFRGWPRTAVSSFTTAWVEGNGSDVPNSIGKDFTEAARRRMRRFEPQVLRISRAEVSRGGFVARGKVWGGCKVPGWWAESDPIDEAEVSVALASDRPREDSRPVLRQGRRERPCYRGHGENSRASPF